jgi:hypothetical protein
MHREIVIPKATNQPVLDMMDASDRSYQITVGKKHGVNMRRLDEMVKVLKSTPEAPLQLYFVILEDRLKEFTWNYEEFVLDDEVIRLEDMKVEELQKKLKDLQQSTKGKKEDLVKRILNHNGIQAETSYDIAKRIEECVRFYMICMPKNPDLKIQDMIQKLHEKSQ